LEKRDTLNLRTQDKSKLQHTIQKQLFLKSILQNREILPNGKSREKLNLNILQHLREGFLDVPSSQKTSTGKENQDENCSGVTKYPLPNNVTPTLKKASADNETSKASNVDNNMVQEKNKDRDDDDGGMHSAREHFPVDFVNGNVAKYPQFHPPGLVSPDLMFSPMGDLVHVNHPATRASSSYATTSTTSQQAFPACPSQDDYRSFLHVSSTFSNLIMSTLLQNPAAHAAATLAASVWPYTNNVGDSSTQMS
ncbi:unnamed protein product, partial [Brassica oleracea var. botrytis]